MTASALSLNRVVFAGSSRNSRIKIVWFRLTPCAPRTPYLDHGGHKAGMATNQPSDFPTADPANGAHFPQTAFHDPEPVVSEWAVPRRFADIPNLWHLDTELDMEL